MTKKEYRLRYAPIALVLLGIATAIWVLTSPIDLLNLFTTKTFEPSTTTSANNDPQFELDPSLNSTSSNEVFLNNSDQDVLPQLKAKSPPENSRDKLNFLNNLHSCLPKLSHIGAKNSKELLDDLQRLQKAKSHLSEIKNIHIKLANGDIRRIHLLHYDQNQSEVRVFLEDEDGNPAPIELNPKLAINPSQAYINSLIQDGTVIYTDSQESFEFADGVRLKVKIRNGEVHELRLFLDNKSFNCASDACLCL